METYLLENCYAQVLWDLLPGSIVSQFRVGACTLRSSRTNGVYLVKLNGTVSKTLKGAKLAIQIIVHSIVHGYSTKVASRW